MILRALAALAAVVTTAGAADAQVYAVATNPQGALTYNAGVAVSKVVNDKLKLQFRVQPMAGSSTYVPLLNTGEVDLGFLNVEETLGAVHGVRSFEGKPNPNVRVLVSLFPLPVAYVVPADSPIKSIHDLKGKRIPVGFIGQLTLKVIQDATFNAIGLAAKDVTGVPVVNTFQGVDALREGKVDAAMTGVGIAQVQQDNVDMSSRGGVRYIPAETDPKLIAEISKTIPIRPLIMEPAPHLPGIIAPIPVLIYSMFLLANAKVSDDLAYRLVKVLHESREDLIKVTPVVSRFDPAKMSEKIDAPWHPGAIKFYTEVGQWPPKG